MHPSSQFMIHNPWTIAIGDEKEMESTVRFLKQAKKSILTIYTDNTEKSSSEISKLMNEETFFTAEEAVEQGFADSIVDHSDSSDSNSSAKDSVDTEAKNQKQQKLLNKLKLRINQSSLEQSRLRAQTLKV